MLYIPLQFAQYEKQDPLDTGVIQSGMSELKLWRVLVANFKVK